MAEEKILIENKPNSDDLWDGIGGHFSSLSQVIHELVDNSISNFRSNNELNHRSVFIHFDTINAGTDKVNVTIEDTGTGLLDLSAAFTLGDRSARESALNEHGFGLKHALASSNPENNAWEIFTRRKEDLDNNNVLYFKAPYTFNEFGYHNNSFNPDNYPTFLGNVHTGTIIRFTTSLDFYNTMGKHGAKVPNKVLAHLIEDLGFIYSEVINSNEVDLQVRLNENEKIFVKSVNPIIKSTLRPEGKEISLDLAELAGGSSSGNIKVKYHFMTIQKRERTPEDIIQPVYYLANLKSQGVEIRLNGRMIENNILWDIWGIEKHNSHNNFLVRIDLISDNHSSLPTTKSSKNGFRRGDIKLEGLFNWIRKVCPEAYETKYDRKETSLIKELKNSYEKFLEGKVPGLLSVNSQERVLDESGEYLEIDLAISYENTLIIYEAKKTKTKAIDLYQLRLYWDALILEGRKPTLAILLATEHGNLVEDLLYYNNAIKDGSGNNYNFQLKVWKDEGIIYPPKEI